MAIIIQRRVGIGAQKMSTSFFRHSFIVEGNIIHSSLFVFFLRCLEGDERFKSRR